MGDANIKVEDVLADPAPGYVRRIGKIFEVGSYPEKGFTLTEQEADRAIAEFTPVGADVEHKDTILSGKLGVMQRIWRDGRAIFGAADVPQWLEEVLKDAVPAVSCAWHKQTKKLEGWGWVLDPHIGDAALFSAYAAFTRSQAGGQPDPEPDPEPLVPEKESNKMTLIDRIREKMGVASFTADPVDPAAPTDPPEATPPAATEPVKAPPPAYVAPGAPAPAAAAPPAAAGVTGAANPSDEERSADFTVTRIKNQAVEIVDGLIRDGYLYSAGRQAALAAFTAAGFDNEQVGPSVVTFTRSDNTVLNDRVQMLREVLKQVPQHTLFQSTLPVHILNGDKGRSAQATAEEEGRAQAQAYNATLGGGVISANGNGSANGSANGKH